MTVNQPVANQLRFALYTRVSTEDQAKEGFSLDAQLDRLRWRAKAEGWAIAGEYVDDGHSGRTTKRPAYQAMLAAHTTWDGVLVMKMDRIHRNSRNFMDMVDWMRANNKQFVSATESLDTSNAVGRAIMDILQRLAQMESEQTGERVFVGMEHKAKSNGGPLGKPAPFGYQYSGGVLVPVPKEAALVREVFERFLAGARKQQLADWLNDKGVRGRRGKPWTIETVSYVLGNPTYKGCAAWNGHLQTGTHAPIVDALTFDATQAHLAGRLTTST